MGTADVTSQMSHIYRSPATKGYKDAATGEPGKDVLSALPAVTVDLNGPFMI
jgi:hypothetical protein